MIGAPELLMTAFMVLFPAVGLYVAYWIVRLGVRHGMHDVFLDARQPPSASGLLSSSEGSGLLSSSEGSRRADSTGR